VARGARRVPAVEHVQLAARGGVVDRFQGAAGEGAFEGAQDGGLAECHQHVLRLAATDRGDAVGREGERVAVDEVGALRGGAAGGQGERGAADVVRRELDAAARGLTDEAEGAGGVGARGEGGDGAGGAAQLRGER